MASDTSEFLARIIERAGAEAERVEVTLPEPAAERQPAVAQRRVPAPAPEPVQVIHKTTLQPDPEPDPTAAWAVWIRREIAAGDTRLRTALEEAIGKFVAGFVGEEVNTLRLRHAESERRLAAVEARLAELEAPTREEGAGSGTALRLVSAP